MRTGLALLKSPLVLGSRKLNAYPHQNPPMKLIRSLILCILLLPAALSARTIVDAHGPLHIDGPNIKDQYGRVVQLQGMSFFWHQWENSAAYWNRDVIRWLREDWKLPIVRGAVGVNPGDCCDYLGDPVSAMNAITRLIDACIAEGIYVIVDWHSHHLLLDEATTFFDAIASRYGDTPNIIYEIFNEPVEYDWSNQIKPYAEQIITTIRTHAPNAIIAVGTPNWDQRVSHAAADPITHDSLGHPAYNIAYVMHFYAGDPNHALDGSGYVNLRAETEAALNNGLCVIVTEAGAVGTSAGPNNVINWPEWDRYVEWMDSRSITWLQWSLSIKNEKGSVLYPSASLAGSWRESDLTPEGRRMREYFRNTVTIPDDPISSQLLDRDMVAISHAGGAASFAITSNLPWTITGHENIPGLHLSATSGTTAGIVTVQLTPSPGLDRTIELSVSAIRLGGDPITQRLVVEQRAVPLAKTTLFRFHRSDNSSHFFTANPDERDSILANLPSNVWTLEGRSHQVIANETPLSRPVYRLYNRLAGSHFYTMSRAELDQVLATMGDFFTLEGVAFFALDAPHQGALPVYRFYSSPTASHFFTISEAEKQWIIDNIDPSRLRYEGVAWYAFP